MSLAFLIYRSTRVFLSHSKWSPPVLLCSSHPHLCYYMHGKAKTSLLSLQRLVTIIKKYVYSCQLKCNNFLNLYYFTCSRRDKCQTQWKLQNKGGYLLGMYNCSLISCLLHDIFAHLSVNGKNYKENRKKYIQTCMYQCFYKHQRTSHYTLKLECICIEAVLSFIWIVSLLKF